MLDASVLCVPGVGHAHRCWDFSQALWALVSFSRGQQPAWVVVLFKLSILSELELLARSCSHVSYQPVNVRTLVSPSSGWW